MARCSNRHAASPQLAFCACHTGEIARIARSHRAARPHSCRMGRGLEKSSPGTEESTGGAIVS